MNLLCAWRHWQQAEQRAAGLEAAGWMFTDCRGGPVHPQAISQAFERIARRAGVPVIRLQDYADVGTSTIYATRTRPSPSRPASIPRS